MECLYRWATLFLLLYLSINVENVFCQNIPLERILPEVSTQPQTGNSKREVTQTQSPSKAQLINALFSYAAAKGLLPKTTQIIQSATLPQEQLEAASQKSLNTFNIVPLQPQISSNCEKIRPIAPNIPAVSTNPIPNPILPPITPPFPPSITMQPTPKIESVSWSLSPTAYQVCSETCPQTVIPNTPAVSTNPIPNPTLPSIAPPFPPLIAMQPTARTESVSWSFCPTTYQVSAETCTQPSQTIWQIPPPPIPVPGVHNCPSNQQVVYNEVIPPYPYLQFTPLNCVTPINTECYTVDNLCETDCGTLAEEPLVVITDGKSGIPINLKINVPSPTDLCPSITIVTAPANPEPVAPTFSPYGFPPPLPIMRKSRSCLRKLLPILLLALIDDCGCCGCNCDYDDPIPIPYPIPVPVNNPIVNSVCYSQCSPRNRG